MSLHNTSNRGTIVTSDELEWIYQVIVASSKRGLQGKGLSLKPLYTKTQLGGDPKMFHDLTDNKGPLLTIFSTASGDVGGCYVDGQQGYLGVRSEPGSALFRLRKQGGALDRFSFAPKLPSTDIFGSPDHGPSHGSGTYDLSIHTNMSKVCSNPNLGWGADPAGFGVLGGNNAIDLDLAECEVSQVIVEESEPWFTWRKSQVLKKTIIGYQEHFLFPANVLLLGNTGSGKSSFICSVDSAFQGFRCEMARCGKGTGSLTKKFKSFQVLKKVCIWDFMGWDGSEGAFNTTLHDLALDGNLKSGAPLDEKISPKSNWFRADAGVHHKMHVVVGVLPCSEATNKTALERLNLLRSQIINDEDRDSLRLIILLTAPDVFDPAVRAGGVESLGYSQKVKELREKVAGSVGVPIAQVFPVWNYTNETECEEGKDVIALLALRRILEGCIVYFRSLPAQDSDTTGQY